MAGVREKQKQETQAVLLRHARELFEQQGYRKTTVKQVAERAGVAVGTVFVHFPDKSSLLAASLYEGINEVVEEAFATLPTEKGLVATLMHFAECLYRWYRRDVELSKHLLKESLFLTGEWGDQFQEQGEQFVIRLAALIEEARGRGEVAESVQPMFAALSFFSCYFTALLGVVKQPETPLEHHLQMLEMALRWQLRQHED